MEEVEQNVTAESFQECENLVIKDPKMLENNEHIVPKEERDKHPDSSNYNQSNNHVLHVGVIFVLLTIYLGVTNVQKYIVSCVENASIADQVQQHKNKILDYLQQTEKLENAKVLERLLEYKDICKDLEIFTQQQQMENDETEEESDPNVDKINVMKKHVESGSGAIEDNNDVEHEDASGSSGSGDCVKGKRYKRKKSKYSIKTTSTKNGFNKYNKSTKTKYQKNSKKEINLNKKSSTAEPIIYLFALVFIYLLLKAASDINQHYKSQTKNDKRFRRCSLQSYAQIHRPDRRASKGISTKSLPKC